MNHFQHKFTLLIFLVLTFSPHPFFLRFGFLYSLFFVEISGIAFASTFFDGYQNISIILLFMTELVNYF